MKNIFYILPIFLIVSCNIKSSKKESKPNTSTEIEWINFKWHQDSIDGKYYDKLGFNVPITINDSLHFFAQFDLGANTNMLYETTLKKNFDLEASFDIDTLNTGSHYYWLNNPNIKIGNKKSTLKKWVILNNYDAAGLIGTIGAEEFQEKCLIIDYPKHRLSIIDTINNNYLTQFTVFDFKTKNGKVILEANINGEKHDINFDTGTSITPLLVSDLELYEKLTNPKIASDTLKGLSSWGNRFENIPGSAIKESFSIGDFNLGQPIVYYIDSDYHRKLFEQDNIIGLSGSILFYDHEIFIDFKNKKMGIKK